MQRRETRLMHPVHARCRDGITHAVRRGAIACGAPNVPECTVTTQDPIDCMTCLSRGLESDTSMTIIPFQSRLR